MPRSLSRIGPVARCDQSTSAQRSGNHQIGFIPSTTDLSPAQGGIRPSRRRLYRLRHTTDYRRTFATRQATRGGWERSSHSSLSPRICHGPSVPDRRRPEWLRQHLPANILLRDQATFSLGDINKVEFRVDLLLIDRETGRPLILLDTKYKTPSGPSSSDLEQVIAYAKAFG